MYKELCISQGAPPPFRHDFGKKLQKSTLLVKKKLIELSFKSVSLINYPIPSDLQQTVSFLAKPTVDMKMIMEFERK